MILLCVMIWLLSLMLVGVFVEWLSLMMWFGLRLSMLCIVILVCLILIVSFILILVMWCRCWEEFVVVFGVCVMMMVRCLIVWLVLFCRLNSCVSGLVKSVEVLLRWVLLSVLEFRVFVVDLSVLCSCLVSGVDVSLLIRVLVLNSCIVSWVFVLLMNGMIRVFFVLLDIWEG